MPTARPHPAARPHTRRVTRTAALTMGALAVGTAAAPTALAVQGPDGAGHTTPETAGTAAPQVLTTAPVLRLGSETEPVDFGTGKAAVSVAPEPGSSYPADVALDLSGAQVQVTATGSADGDDFFLDMLGGAGATATCTTVADGTCVFPAPAGLTAFDVGSEEGITLLPGVRYTITQLSAPASQQLLLPSASDRVVHAQVIDPLIRVDQLDEGTLEATVAAVQDGTETVLVDPATGRLTTAPTGQAAPGASVQRLAPAVSDPADDADSVGSITFFDPGAYRPITATVTDAGGTPVEGVGLALCTVRDGDCAGGGRTVDDTSDVDGLVTFPGSYLAGTYQATVTSAPSGFALPTTSFPITLGLPADAADVATPFRLPVVLAAVASPAPPAPAAPAPVAGTALSSTATGPQLAYTGTEARPLLAVAGGLLATGAAALVAVRRRRTS